MGGHTAPMGGEAVKNTCFIPQCSNNNLDGKYPTNSLKIGIYSTDQHTFVSIDLLWVSVEIMKLVPWLPINTGIP